ncbi:MAG: AAA family ATPase, partial [Elusimicrobia bacterium]|nr:AAA family ATPase [Elusimicrobiota bacterium]MBD3412654.1 AAA family ATPase [Elusimicrobiota bacterium]
MASFRKDMSFDRIIGHKRSIDILNKHIANQRLAHAYLFCGPHGVGKASTAKAFARSLQCPNNGDDNCPICKRIDENNYSDVEIVDYDWQAQAVARNKKQRTSQRQTLGIDAIHVLQTHVSLKPMEGKYKIFIIDHADTMTPEAVNSFLKILEEPPSHTIFVLI